MGPGGAGLMGRLVVRGGMQVGGDAGDGTGGRRPAERCWEIGCGGSEGVPAGAGMEPFLSAARRLTALPPSCCAAGPAGRAERCAGGGGAGPD